MRCHPLVQTWLVYNLGTFIISPAREFCLQSLHPWPHSREGFSVPWTYRHWLPCTKAAVCKGAISFAWASFPGEYFKHPESETQTEGRSLASLLEAELAALILLPIRLTGYWWLLQMGQCVCPHGLQSKSQLWQNYHTLEIWILMPLWVLVRVVSFQQMLFPLENSFLMWILKHIGSIGHCRL